VLNPWRAFVAWGERCFDGTSSEFAFFIFCVCVASVGVGLGLAVLLLAP
jgi:NADH:ubiquinone oxidoreductase subunit K